MHYGEQVVLKGTNHVVSMRRVYRGTSQAGGRLYGYKMKCSSCGWAAQHNGTKREARSSAMDHLRAVKAKR